MFDSLSFIYSSLHDKHGKCNSPLCLNAHHLIGLSSTNLNTVYTSCNV